MKTRILTSDRSTKWSTLLLALVLMGIPTNAVWAINNHAKPDEKKTPALTTISTGSGEKYKTTVDQQSGGELSPEDFRQVSLLSSRALLHLNEAVTSLDEERVDDARAAVKHGLDLVKVIRELLPTTKVTTIVRDSKGTEVYRHEDNVQDDRIPLHEGLVAVKVVEAITDAKRDAATVKGLRLADADLLHTSVLFDLNYVESKLKRADADLPDKPQEAREQLLLAQSNGVGFSVNKEDDPLVAAQMALQLAEQMVEEDRPEAAKANLQQAKNQLVLYHGLVGEYERDEVKKLEADITKLQANIENSGAAGEIRAFWDQVANWFSREHRETRTAPSEEKAKVGS